MKITFDHLKLEPFPYQKEGIQFIEDADGIAFIGDQPGLGKTIQGLGYASFHQFKTLIVCPSYLKYNWDKEIKKFTHLKGIVLSTQNPPKSLQELDDYNFIIVNYDIIHKESIYPFLYHTNFDCVICDESHYLMNFAAKRTQHTVALIHKIPHRILLTGTPLKSFLEQFFTQLYALHPELPEFQDYKTFKYAINNDPDNLHQLIGSFYLRRLKEDVLKDLPPKIFSITPLELDSDTRNHYNHIMSVTNKGKGEILTAINKSRQLLSVSKIPTIVEFVEPYFHANEKVIIFSQFTETLLKLKEIYGDNAVLHKGGIDASDKQLAIDNFQTNSNCKVLLANIATAVGYTATSSATVLFADLPWTPADVQQAVDRSHRIGQTKTVHVNYLIFENTLEENIYNLLCNKESLINEYINLKQPTANLSIQDELVDEIAA